MWNGHWSTEEIESMCPTSRQRSAELVSLQKMKKCFPFTSRTPIFGQALLFVSGFFPRGWNKLKSYFLFWLHVEWLGFLLDKCEMDGTTTTTTTTTTTLTITATTTYFIFTLEGMDSDINKLEIQKKIWNNMNPSHGVKPVQLILSPSNSEMSIVSLVVVCNQCCQGKITHYYK